MVNVCAKYRKAKKHLIKNIENYNMAGLLTLIELNYHPVNTAEDRIKALIFRLSVRELLKRIDEGCCEAMAKRISCN